MERSHPRHGCEEADCSGGKRLTLTLKESPALAKQPSTQQQPTRTPAPLVPIVTDPRTELFFLIGKAGYECNPPMANRMMELVVILTAPATLAETEAP
jgi:hypothetical protein